MQITTTCIIAQLILMAFGVQRIASKGQPEHLFNATTTKTTTTAPAHNVILRQNQIIDNNNKNKRISSARSRILNIFQSNGDVNQNQMSSVGDLLECESTVTWRDLGPLYYPRFLKERTCHRRSRSCMGGYFRCVPVYYPVKVLSEKTDFDDTDMMIPSGLRIRWKFTTIQTAVECICGL